MLNKVIRIWRHWHARGCFDGIHKKSGRRAAARYRLSEYQSQLDAPTPFAIGRFARKDLRPHRIDIERWCYLQPSGERSSDHYCTRLEQSLTFFWWDWYFCQFDSRGSIKCFFFISWFNLNLTEHNSNFKLLLTTFMIILTCKEELLNDKLLLLLRQPNIQNF